jgi:hypothetical protein
MDSIGSIWVLLLQIIWLTIQIFGPYITIIMLPSINNNNYSIWVMLMSITIMAMLFSLPINPNSKSISHEFLYNGRDASLEISVWFYAAFMPFTWNFSYVGMKCFLNFPSIHISLHIISFTRIRVQYLYNKIIHHFILIYLEHNRRLMI